MTRTFAYCRVSTSGQTVENQIAEIKAAGFNLEPHRVISETVSGSTMAADRPEFARLLDRLEKGDVLVVSRIDRLGRNAIDVRSTVDLLAGKGVKVHCLALGGADLTSSAGRMIMGVIASMAEFERDLIVERTHAGLNRARAAGVRVGRPPALTVEQQAEVREKLAGGASILGLANAYGVDRKAIKRARDAAA
jgi:putative DNA-invertase from lambdoid prophage Rac